MNVLAIGAALILTLGGSLTVVAQSLAAPAPQRPQPGGPGGLAAPGETPASASVDPEAGAAPVAVPRTARDPFWPVGFVPRPVVRPGTGPSAQGPGAAPAPVPVVVARPPNWDEARRRLEIKGVSRIGRDKTTGREMYFADVNGRIVEEGDIVSATWDGRLYRWRLTQISAAGVQLTKLDSRAE
jgi:hypothetical protein